MKKLPFALTCALTLALLTGCDSGSITDSKELEDNRCEVSLTSRSSDFNVTMVLSCAGDDYKECYAIEELTCGGETQQVTTPITLADCPGERWCVDDCTESLRGGNGNIWDTPELLSIDACNTYEQ